MAVKIIFSVFLLIGAVYGHEGADGYGLYKYGPAPLGHDGQVIDTPEVAKLKELNHEAYMDALHKTVPHYHHYPVFRTANDGQYINKGQYTYDVKGHEDYSSSRYEFNGNTGYKINEHRGYDIVGSNHGPVRIKRGGDIHDYLIDGVYLPYTPEVAKARHEHFKLYDEIQDHQMKYYHH